MNSSAQPFRRIACNLLWTPRGVVCNPLAEVAPDGTVRAVRICPEPDREPFTEFYAGLLVPDFPADCRAAFDWLAARREQPLDELLARLIPATNEPPATPAPPSDRAVRGSGATAVQPLPGASSACVATNPDGTLEADASVAPFFGPARCLVVLSGLDYDPLRLTAQSQFRLLAPIR